MSWEKLNFMDCIQKTSYSSKIAKKEFKKNGPFPIVSQEKKLINGFWDNSSDLFKCEDKGVVIFGDHTKTLKYINFDFVIGADGVKILKPIEKLDPKFFYYQLRGIQIPDLGYARHFRLLKEYDLIIPPLSEQKQIVETLDKAFGKIDKAIANIERNIQNAEELYDSYLENIFSSENDLWSKESLGHVCHMIKRGVAPKYTEDQTKLLIINQKCIRDHLININHARRHDQKLKKVNPERILKIGDVLVNSTGTGTLGRIAQVKELLEENITVDTHVTIVRPDLSRFYFEFFGYAMIYIENKIKLAGEGTSGQTELSRIKLSDNFFISFPGNIDLQKELTSKISLVDDSTKNLIVAFKEKISELKDLKKSILEKAFKGELTSTA